jgi:CrcB protein
MGRFALVCLGGAAGTGVRYLVNLWATPRLGTGFPYATLIVNLAGCFLISLVMYIALRAVSFSEDLRLVLTTGFMGGLTTYSAFNYETSKLLDSGASATAAANVGITLVGCFAAGYLGMLIGRALVGS